MRELIRVVSLQPQAWVQLTGAAWQSNRGVRLDITVRGHRRGPIVDRWRVCVSGVLLPLQRDRRRAEAKRYGRGGVGVQHTSRLVSRLRFRQFGILVTTGYVAEQAYKEIREDNPPILVLSARDIIEILTARGYSTPGEVKDRLVLQFPVLG